MSYKQPYVSNDGKLHSNCKHNEEEDTTICDKCLSNNKEWYTYWEPIEGEQSK